MAGTKIHTTYPCQLNAATNFRQLGSVDVSWGQDVDDVIPAGSLDRAACITRSAKPVVSIQTTDLATVLAAVTAGVGLSCTGSSTFFWQQRSSGSTFEGAGGHVKLTAPIGHAYLRSLGVSGEGPAILDILFEALYNGSTEPLLATTGQSLGASTPTFSSQYYRGPAYFDGSTLLNGVQSSSVDFGLAMNSKTQSQDPYPRTTSVISRTPLFSVTIDDAAGHGSFASPNGTSGGFKVFFVKGAAGTTRAANGNHVSVSCSTGVWYPAGDSGSGSGDSQHTFICRPTSTLTVTLNDTIP